MEVWEQTDFNSRTLHNVGIEHSSDRSDGVRLIFSHGEDFGISAQTIARLALFAVPACVFAFLPF
jgi:hypothetical protein